MSIHFNNFHKDVSKETASSGGRKDGTAGARRGRKRRGSDEVMISHGSVSVFSVGIGFRFFGRFFFKSVRFSVSVFQNIAISVSVSVFY